jgi:hypothetical protein
LLTFTFSRIDEETGDISLRRPLDRERQPVHTLDVAVTDAGDPPLVAATVLEVVVDDGLLPIFF